MKRTSALRKRLRNATDSVSVRTRILTTVVSLSALGLLVAGASAYLLQTRAVDERVDTLLRNELTEFTNLATTGVDPGTGEGFNSARDLIYASMQLSIPNHNEGMIGVLGNNVTLTAAAGVPIRLESDRELITALDSVGNEPNARLRTVHTETTTYRVLTIPVQIAPQEGPFKNETHGAIVRAIDMDAEHGEFRHVFTTFALVGFLALVLVSVIGWFLAGRLLRPVRILDETARRISESDMSMRIPVTSNDDLGRLTRTVNDTFDRLEHAFASQRNLLDDVGHELRTPITIIRGHLELMDEADPQDAASTREIALSELARMSRLVTDLIVLADSERPGFVQPQPTPVGELLDDLLETLTPLADRHWIIEERVEADVRLDAQRITQAVVQLAANAVRFSEPHSVIALKTRITKRKPNSGTPSQLDICVRDEGTGIAPSDQAKIFQRFSRGPDGHQPHDGAGLGLSIVSAIAHGHGGSVTVDSELGTGTTFTMTIPIRPTKDTPRHATSPKKE